ncbi:hypothetical protein, partial [Novosphingobium sp. BW1]|uniref:hypothetical protein n=1 Tax=Novosphingobium sp. BW1 TaxID=2592621 RepID=UPI0019672082
LNAGLWLRRGRLLILCSCLAAHLAALRQKIQLSQCADSPGHLCQKTKAAPNAYFLEIIRLRLPVGADSHCIPGSNQT